MREKGGKRRGGGGWSKPCWAGIGDDISNVDVSVRGPTCTCRRDDPDSEESEEKKRRGKEAAY